MFATPAVTENCGVPYRVVRNSRSCASAFVLPIDTTTVTFTATDIHGNTETTALL